MSNKRIDKIFARAKEAVSSNDKIKNLIGEVKGKIEEINDDTETRNSFVRELQVIVRMIRAHFSGTYTAFSISTILTLVFGLVYFITPIDLIPDFIPALGFTDDVSLIYMIIRSLAEDVAHFKEWEATS